MHLFVGLGNPGKKYARTRHNIGWMAVDEIAREFGPWRSKFQGEIAEGRLGGEKLLLLKPMTFMNESGRSVGEAMRFYGLAPGDVVVFHDELDLAPGKCRIKIGGGHAGHNGLRSLHAHIGPDFARVRLGIGHPGDKAKVMAHVLHDFARSDEAWLTPLIQGIGANAEKLIAGDHNGFMNAIARETAQHTRSDTISASGPSSASHPSKPQDKPFAPLQRLARRFGLR